MSEGDEGERDRVCKWAHTLLSSYHMRVSTPTLMSALRCSVCPRVDTCTCVYTHGGSSRTVDKYFTEVEELTAVLGTALELNSYLSSWRSHTVDTEDLHYIQRNLLVEVAAHVAQAIFEPS